MRRLNAFQLCRLARAITFAPFSGVVTGVVFYEDFVPYIRVKAAGSRDS